jgi:hypothetical protein
MADPSGIIEIRKDYKKKIRDILDKNISSIKSEDIQPLKETKEEVDTSVGESNNEQVAQKEQHIQVRLPEKYSSSDDNQPKDSVSQSTKTHQIVNDLVDKLDKKTNAGSDQASYNEVSVVELSDKTMDRFTLIGKTVLPYMEDAFEKVKPEKSEKTGIENVGSKSFLADMIGTITKLLLVGGLATTLVAVFWKDNIKPWLESNLGVSLASVDKFMRVLEGIGKWFTLGSMGAGGVFLKLKGEVFESIGTFMEKSIGKAMAGILGEGAEQGLAGGAAKFFSGATVTKLIGKSLKGMSKAVLKGIPVIGSLFSFWFAYDSFKSGDTIGGFVNVASGLANLLNLVLPGIGTGLSLGIDVLGAILDVKAGDGTGAEVSAKKADILKDWAGTLWNMLKGVPIIQTLIDFGEGFYKVFSGDFKGGLEQLNKLPMLGIMPGILLAIYNTTSDSSDSTPKTFGDKMKQLNTELKKRIGTSILGMFPTVFGLRGRVAKMLGLDYSNPDDEHSKSPEATVPDENLAAIQKDIRQKKIEIGHLEKDNSITDEERATKIKELDDNIKMYERFMKNPDTKPMEKSANDLFLPPNNDNKIVYNPTENVSYKLASDDNVMAYKAGGAFDETIKEIKNAMLVMSAKMLDIQIAVVSNTPASSNINVNNITSNNKSEGTPNMSGKRDPIFDARMDYWRKYPTERSYI